MDRFLRRGGLYQRAKVSWLYDFYWRITNRQIIDDRRRELDFYRNLLEGFRSGDLIFDIGANQGYKADIFLRLDARVLAVEPDENSAEILKQKFIKYRLKKRPIAIVIKAASESCSVEKFWIDVPGSAKSTLSQKWVETLRADAKRFGAEAESWTLEIR
jgi:FkbM family methyltransferase